MSRVASGTPQSTEGDSDSGPDEGVSSASIAGHNGDPLIESIQKNNDHH